MSALEVLRSKQSEIQSIAAKHGAGNLRAFGSVTRGDARENSDVDFLIDIVAPTTSWFPGGLLTDLETALGRRVDIVIARSLHPLLRESVLKEAVPLPRWTPENRPYVDTSKPANEVAEVRTRSVIPREV